VRLFLDTETRSRIPIRRGLDLYTRNCTCLIVTYAVDDGPVKIWEPYVNFNVPLDFAEAFVLADEIVAHNSEFDRLVLMRCLQMEAAIERWRCTRAQAYAHGLPGSLEMLGDMVGLPPDQQKLTEDKHLIDTFCVPQAGTNEFIQPWELPNEWCRFCDYAIRDTESLRSIYLRLPGHNYRGDNLYNWHLDQLINSRGIGFDGSLATAAQSLLADAKEDSDTVVASNTNKQVQSATQRDRLLRYVNDTLGVPISNLRAFEVREWLERDDLHPIARVLLQERLEAGKSSGAKFARGLDMVGPDGRLRHCIQWNGAGRTGRHSGKSINPHNFSRPVVAVRTDDGRIELRPVKASHVDDVVIPAIYSKRALNDRKNCGTPQEACNLALRHTIVAAPGNELVTADFKNIESVITAWLAGEAAEVEAFEKAFADPHNKALDVYRIQFAAFFGGDPLDVSDQERQCGKVAKLAFGFGGGVGALVTMAAGYQMDLEPLATIILPRATLPQAAKAYKAWRRAFLLSEDFELEPKVYQACDVLKQVYRTTNKKINEMRLQVQDCVMNAVKNRGVVFNAARCQIWATSSFLIISLPSGRRLLYAAPRIERDMVTDPDGGPTWETEYVTYATVRGRRSLRERAWSGLFVENIVQATANDILRAAMNRVHKDTLTVPAIQAYLGTLPEHERTAISMHVHDEIVLDVPKGSYSKERFMGQLTTRESWMTGLPIAADIWINPRYGKR
jgi:DNA polymerase